MSLFSATWPGPFIVLLYTVLPAESLTVTVTLPLPRLPLTDASPEPSQSNLLLWEPEEEPLYARFPSLAADWPPGPFEALEQPESRRAMRTTASRERMGRTRLGRSAGLQMDSGRVFAS